MLKAEQLSGYSANDPNHIRIILAPDRSMNWRQTRFALLIIGATCLTIALGFGLAVGAWIILPLAGLEVTMLSAAFYYVSWKMNYRQIISINKNAETILVEKGVYRPIRKITLNYYQTVLEVTPPTHDWEAAYLDLVERQSGKNTREIGIGEFLSKRDAERLIALLGESMDVRTMQRTE